MLALEVQAACGRPYVSKDACFHGAQERMLGVRTTLVKFVKRQLNDILYSKSNGKLTFEKFYLPARSPYYNACGFSIYGLRSSAIFFKVN